MDASCVGSVVDFMVVVLWNFVMIGSVLVWSVDGVYGRDFCAFRILAC